jgi:16S rRNA (adenine1518-N6/adenine1519-N6)-dimethyltransferase
MDESQYRGVIDSMRPHKRLGQSFLVKRYVAVAEAEYCRGKRVIELGPGLGILTEELCKVARHVTSIEIDRNIYAFLVSNVMHENCTIINSDFFSMKDYRRADMMASNVPYNLSSRTLMWLVERRMPAVLCLQKEFVDRMTAKAGTGNYSKLSVFCSLQFDVERVMKVPADSFYPTPKVDSAVVVLKPKKFRINKEEMRIITLMMEHKNKKVRNAIEDSSRYLGIRKDDARKRADGIAHHSDRVTKLEPKVLVQVAREMLKSLE